MTAPLASTAPSHGENHPAALAFHCLNNASRILRGDYLDIAGVDRVRELLDEGTVQVGALHALLERQERVIEEQRVECLREKRYSARVEGTNSELAQSVISMARQLEMLGFDTSTLPRRVAAGA